MKRVIPIILMSLMVFHEVNAQTVIQMEEYGGVYRIPCKVNGAKMKLIFDTGADKVCLSLSMADYLWDNDYITEEDIVGRGKSTVADGSIVNHIKVILRDIEIQGIHLREVEAVVMDGQDAPLLLGQSALRKLGKYSISGSRLIIDSNQPTYSQNMIDSIKHFAIEAGNKGYYDIAIEQLGKLYENELLDVLWQMVYAEYLNISGYHSEALNIFLQIQFKIETNYPDEKIRLYDNIGYCYYLISNFEKAILYFNKIRLQSSDITDPYVMKSIHYVIQSYKDSGNDYMAKKFIDGCVQEYLQKKAYNSTDCWTHNRKDPYLGELYYERSLSPNDYDRRAYEYYIIYSAAWGYDPAIHYCQSKNIDFHSAPYDSKR